MGIKQEIVYQEYINRENEFSHAAYDPELEFYTAIRTGDEKTVKKLCQPPLMDKEGLGTLSEHAVQNMKYHFVITTALVARYCIDGGMDIAEAFGLSDFYIMKADKMYNIKDISDLHQTMCLDYTERMKHMVNKEVRSIPISQCLDYIYTHLHTKITVPTLAKHVGLSENHLSRLFKKEMGININKYIQNKRIETAKNMLAHSEHSLSEIAMTLAFPNQSYFTEIFHKATGFTPAKYRATFYHKTDINKKERF